MHFRTIFNRVTDYKPFVVDHVHLVEHDSGPVREVTMRARGNGQSKNSVCVQRYVAGVPEGDCEVRFRAGGALSSGVVEGFNNKRKLITRKSYGFRTQTAYETALYHNLGDLRLPRIHPHILLRRRF